MQTLRLCVFLTFIVGLRAYELSRSLSELYCVVNGNYNNRGQLENDGANHVLMEMTINAVLAPAISPIPVIYAEEFVAGALTRSLLYILSEEDGQIYTDPYNFTGNTEIRPETFNPDTIKSLTRKDLHGKQDCREAFERVEPFVFVLNYPLCEQTATTGQRESYGVTFACKELIVVSPVEAPEKPTLVPYHLKLQGSKYPLEDAPGDYVCNCDQVAEGDN